MASSNFIDYVKIYFKSGKGGDGCVHFRREKYVPKGGPDGGDGGRGGHIILRGNKQLWTLLHLKYKKHIKAPDGQPGRGKNMTGAKGQDIIIDVPLGTVAKDPETGKILLEITKHNETKILFPGGKGGLGNTHFKSPTNQAPKIATPGQPGKEGWVILELKILADVGLVGFPNAGKSTLLSTLTAAKPKIADYPFTTLTPHVGIVHYKDFKSFVMADIPGIIQGAAQGKGLGLNFLRHIERNAILLFLLPADTLDFQQQYQILLHELKQYNPQLLKKQRIIAISKSDLLDNELKQQIKQSVNFDVPWLFISAVTGEGLNQLKNLLWQKISLAKQYSETQNFNPNPD
jgi:GTP-binding protein